MQTSDVQAVLNLVAQRPGLLGREIAARLGLTRQRVNSILYRDLAGKVRQDREYRWWPAGAVPTTDARPLPLGEPVADSPVAQLCRYYLACLAREAVGEVTVFAAGRHRLDYVELGELPVLSDATQEGIGQDVRGLIRGARQAAASLSAYVGYPTLLRRHVARDGREGFFVEPILLFPVHALDRLGGPGPHTIDTLPSINPAAMRRLGVVDGGGAGAMYEAIALAEELGLTAPPDELPEPDEVALRLPGVRPDWNWAEPIDPYALSSEPPLNRVDTEGIYNRAVLVVTESPPYTRGLEMELRQLADVAPDKYQDAALGAWVTGSQAPGGETADPGLLEVVPLNPEQRRAVLQGLSNPLTVVTGPPGTGKSQVVISLLANAAWRGQTALLASKNNKAVDVVVERTNGLSSRPLLIRLGRDEHQQQLGIYIASLLAAATTPEDEAEFRAAWSRLVAGAEEMQRLDAELDAVIALRNTVERLGRETEDHRSQLGDEAFGATRHLDEDVIRDRSRQVVSALDAADRDTQGFLIRWVWPLVAPRRCRALASAAEALGEVTVPPAARPEMGTGGRDLPQWLDYATLLLRETEVALAARSYFRALDSLQAARPPEDIAPLRSAVADRVVDRSQEVWRAWLKLQPARITPEQRRDLAAFGAVLRLLLAARGGHGQGRLWAQFHGLLPKVTSALPCWAVPSLSARGRVPFVPGFFDLLVVDEASQCDIASALPLLFRAKRVVVIGDPMQLPHISTLSTAQDQQLRDQHLTGEDSVRWSYPAVSLFHLAQGLASAEDMVVLKDHHRSHLDIIQFSNEHFYDGDLRVVTRYQRLRRPAPAETAVRWVDVAGKARRPPDGGAVNEVEAQAVVDQVRHLLLDQAYTGTIGVVTPFRAQANLIRRLLHEKADLVPLLEPAELLVDTAHAFQGDERDVVFFSPVVAPGIASGALWFLNSSGNLFNVGITRARSALIAVGDLRAALVSEVGHLAAFAQYCQRVAAEQGRELDLHADLGPAYPPVARPDEVSDWERYMYQVLYGRGFRPVPQYPVDQYRLDFALFAEDRRLDLEIDGEHHRDWDGELCRRDQIRNQRLIELGWDVMRFWVCEVRDDLERCLDRVERWSHG